MSARQARAARRRKVAAVRTFVLTFPKLAVYAQAGVDAMLKLGDAFKAVAAAIGALPVFPLHHRL